MRCWESEKSTAMNLRKERSRIRKAHTPLYDRGRRHPAKKRVKKLLITCVEFSGAYRERLSFRGKLQPGFATIYHSEFLTAFREICRIYKNSSFIKPEAQVLILMKLNKIYPCRALNFSEAIVRRLANGIFNQNNGS